MKMSGLIKLYIKFELDSSHVTLIIKHSLTIKRDINASKVKPDSLFKTKRFIYILLRCADIPNISIFNVLLFGKCKRVGFKCTKMTN